MLMFIAASAATSWGVLYGLREGEGEKETDASLRSISSDNILRREGGRGGSEAITDLINMKMDGEAGGRFQDRQFDTYKTSGVNRRKHPIWSLKTVFACEKLETEYERPGCVINCRRVPRYLSGLRPYMQSSSGKKIEYKSLGPQTPSDFVTQNGSPSSVTDLPLGLSRNKRAR